MGPQTMPAGRNPAPPFQDALMSHETSNAMQNERASHNLLKRALDYVEAVKTDAGAESAAHNDLELAAWLIRRAEASLVKS